MQSEIVNLQLEVNSLTEEAVCTLAQGVSKTQSLTAAFLLSRGFSNLVRHTRSPHGNISRQEVLATRIKKRTLA